MSFLRQLLIAMVSRGTVYPHHQHETCSCVLSVVIIIVPARARGLMLLRDRPALPPRAPDSLRRRLPSNTLAATRTHRSRVDRRIRAPVPGPLARPPVTAARADESQAQLARPSRIRNFARRCDLLVHVMLPFYPRAVLFSARFARTGAGGIGG